MNSESLKNFVENNPNLVSKKQIEENMYILKYTKKVFYKNLWNEFLENSRGTIIDSEFNIISYPFTKVYNPFEKNAPKFSENDFVHYFRKINGFMAAITWHNNDLLISTTGSINSVFVEYIKESIGENLDMYKKVISNFPEKTFLFECVHENDPHIIQEIPGMYYLGERNKYWNSKIEHSSIIPNLLKTIPVEDFSTNYKNLLNIVKNVDHEGFVVYNNSSECLKLKSPYYLAAKAIARFPRNINELDMNKLDEEFYPLLDHVKSLENFSEMDEQSKLKIIREFFKEG